MIWMLKDSGHYLAAVEEVTGQDEYVPRQEDAIRFRSKRHALACRKSKNSREGLTLVRVNDEAKRLRELVDDAIKLALDSSDLVMADFLSDGRRTPHDPTGEAK